MADSDSGGEAPVKRGRGRPKGTTKSGEPYVPKPKVAGRGRGRPKGLVAKSPKKPKAVAKNGGAGKGRGRPPKKRPVEDAAESNGAPAEKKSRGRPSKAKPEPEEEEEEDEEASETENGAEEGSDSDGQDD